MWVVVLKVRWAQRVVWIRLVEVGLGFEDRWVGERAWVSQNVKGRNLKI